MIIPICPLRQSFTSPHQCLQGKFERTHDRKGHFKLPTSDCLEGKQGIYHVFCARCRPTSTSWHHDKAVPAGHGCVDCLPLIESECAISEKSSVGLVNVLRPGKLTSPLTGAGAISLPAIGYFASYRH